MAARVPSDQNSPDSHGRSAMPGVPYAQNASCQRHGDRGSGNDEPDTLVPDPQVWREFGITSMTGWRWTNDPELGFPPPVKIRNRCFRSRKAIEAFKAEMIRRAIAARDAATRDAKT